MHRCKLFIGRLKRNFKLESKYRSVTTLLAKSMQGIMYGFMFAKLFNHVKVNYKHHFSELFNHNEKVKKYLIGCWFVLTIFNVEIELRSPSYKTVAKIFRELFVFFQFFQKSFTAKKHN